MPKIKSIRHQQAQKEVLHQIVYLTKDRKIAQEKMCFFTKKEIESTKKNINTFYKGRFKGFIFFEDNLPVSILITDNLSNKSLMFIAGKMKHDKDFEKYILSLPCERIVDMILLKIVPKEINTVLEGVEILQPVK